MTAKLKIIKDTLGNAFDYDNYLKFIINFLKKPNLFNKKRDVRIWKEYLNSIEAYYKIGEYKDDEGSEILILAVELKRGSTVERARSLQRNFISKILDGSDYEAAIVAFYTPNEKNWRLSFVKLDYRLTEKGLELDLTPARRFSYLVGENEPTHTAQKRLLSLIEEDSKNPSLDEVEEVFSVEKVTDDFFKHYKEKYLQLKEYLESSPDFIEETEKLGLNVEKFSEQFSKKLMGQISFLYFLQKKGWLGVTLLPKNRNLRLEEYSEIAEALEDRELNILNRTFVLNTNSNLYYMDMEEYKDLSDREIEDLSNIFKNTKFDMAWGTGEKQFIRGLFNFCEESTEWNFFDEYLEPFFYEALNKERKNSYYKRFNCKIPFLNGGLFEPLEGYHWEDVNFKIPNEIFSNRKQKGEYADGILDIFDRYNFTINEAEPLEKEVAVDPEMLGKVFENLLDIESRKSKGAFYTPREIVHFMCQETLTNYIASEVNIPYEDVKKFILYGELMRDQDNTKEAEGKKQYIIPKSIYKNLLEIDKALDNVRVADPAVGSGAFPLGMLTEIVSAKDNITEYIIKKDREGSFQKRFGEDFIRSWRSSYKIKWETIRDCIYAVDIEESAVDITKLRLWLSLVVDQELEQNEDPHPLPNLDMNIHVGNSLIDEYEGIELFDKDILKKKDKSKKTDDTEQLKIFFDSDEILEDMFRKQVEYFEEFDEERKKNLKLGIDNLRDQLIMKRLREDGNLEALEKYEKIKDNKSQPFFIWELEFAKVFKEKGGFDIVIGNPPYVGESGNKELFREVAKTSSGKKYYRGKMDFWYFFTSKGIELLKLDGLLSYIAPNNWMTTYGGQNMRKHIMEDMTIKEFISFGDKKVFDNADQQTMIFLLQKDSGENDFIVNCSVLDTLINNIEDFIKYKNVGNHYRSHISRMDYIDGDIITFLDYSIGSIINKIQASNHIKLKKNEIFQGIVSPQENLNKKNMKKLNSNHVLNEGIFVLEKSEYIQLGELNKNELNLIRPYYTTREIDRYFSNANNNYYIIYSKDEINNNPNVYPTLVDHLDVYKDIITSSNKPYGLHRSRKESIFLGEKIISIRKCKQPSFSYIEFDSYISQTFNIIKTDRINLKYLLGILNSKLVSFWLRFKGKMQGSNYQIDKGPLMEIPIALPFEEYEDQIIKLVESRINNYNDKEIIVIEKKIDSLVYQLYNLTEDEIRIIENYFSEEDDK